MRIIVRAEYSFKQPDDDVDPAWFIIDFSPQLLQEIYDIQNLLKFNHPNQLLLCGRRCRMISFWAEFVGVLTAFHPQYEYYADSDSADFIHDFDPIPEYLTPEQLGTTAKNEETKIHIEEEDIMWSATVNDMRYTCYYSSIANFANLLAQERKS